MARSAQTNFARDESAYFDVRADQMNAITRKEVLKFLGGIPGDPNCAHSAP
jgi:hypothetical protein